MPFASRLCRCLLALSLSFNSPVLAQSQPALSTSSAASGAQNSADETALRTLTETFFNNWAAKDLDGFLRLWSKQSPELAARKKAASELFAGSEKIALKSLAIRQVRVEGDKARVRVEADAQVIETKTGKERAGYGKTLRTLECVKEEGDWKVWRESSTFDELAAALTLAKSDQERAALLAEEKELVTAELTRALVNQGIRFYDQGDFAQAMTINRLGQSIAEQIEDQQGMARALNGIGNVHLAQGDYTQALERFRKSLALNESLNNKAGIAAALTNIGTIHYRLGDYAQALERYQHSLAIKESLGNEAGVAFTLNQSGSVHLSQGDYAKALERFQKSLALSESLGDKAGIARALNYIGRVHRNQGYYAQALERYQKSLALSESLGNKILISSVLNNIGVVHRLQGHYAQALDFFQKSLEMGEAMGSKILIANALNNIGFVRRLQGDYAQALDQFRKSLTLRESTGEKERIAQALNNIADVYLSQGDYAQALGFAERAATISRAIGASGMLQDALTMFGDGCWRLNKTVEARRALEEAITVTETMRANVAGGEEEQQRFFESKVSPYLAMADLLAREGRPTEALTFAERAKARALLDALRSGRSNDVKALTDQEQEQEHKLRAELISLNTQVTRAGQQDKPDQAKLEELKSLREKARLNYEAFQTSLYAAHPGMRARRGEVPVIKAEELTTLLSDDRSAMLEYVVTEEATYLFTVSKAAGKPSAEARVFTLPVKQAELAKQIESFRRQLAGRDLGFRAPAKRLHRLLLKPALAQLRDKTSLVIVPDDKLWELPFQALLAEDNRYVIEKSAVSYAPSLTALREMKAQREKRGTDAAPSALLALGNPAIGRETIERSTLTLRDGKLDPLPEAEREVKALGRLYGAARSKVYVGAEAREDLVKTEAARARVLHFATHGVLNDASPMYSYLALAQGDKNEDGLLEAWELMRLDLRADLVVLSACETARGRFGAGEGVIGLSWAMFVAGAPATVVSQWKVESASTRELMLNFHRALNSQIGARHKPTKSEALRQAALKLMRKSETNHPFYWAGFVLLGDGG